jgi:hypothetical protein
MVDTDGSGRVTVELWIRSDRDDPEGDHDVAVERTRGLLSAGRVDEVVVEEWSHRSDASGPEPAGSRAEHVRGRIAAFGRWADQHGVELSLSAPVEAGTGRTGPASDVRTRPRVLLAEYEDGELRSVVPCTGRDGTCTVEDRLDELFAGISRPPSAVVRG